MRNSRPWGRGRRDARKRTKLKGGGSTSLRHTLVSMGAAGESSVAAHALDMRPSFATVAARASHLGKEIFVTGLDDLAL